MKGDGRRGIALMIGFAILLFAPVVVLGLLAVLGITFLCDLGGNVIESIKARRCR